MMSVKQITDYIQDIVKRNNSSLNVKDIEKFCEKCYSNIILSDGNGNGSVCYDSFKILYHFDKEMNFTNACERRDFLKKIRSAIISHNNKIASKRLDKIRELEQTVRKQNAMISTSKEDLLLDIILKKNPEKFLYDLAFKYDKDRQYKQKIKILEYMVEKGIDNELALIELTSHYIKKERNYEKCKKHGMEGVRLGNISTIGLMAYNELDEDNYNEMIKYFNLLVDKCDINTIIHPEWNLSTLINSYVISISSESEDYITSLSNVKKILSMQPKEYRESVYMDMFYNLEDLKTSIQQYQIFKEICVNNNEIPKEIVNDFDVIKYINKCNLMSKMSECCICLNNDIKCIPLECCHYFCTNCYPKILERGSCPNCRCDI
jgi:hypothetical protein